jgi:hypothetical protein
MVTGMATVKVTITLDEGDFAEIRAMVAKKRVASVSGFVQRAVKIGLQDAAGWRAALAEALEQTGGPMTAAERKWVDRTLDGGTTARPRGRRRKRAA